MKTSVLKTIQSTFPGLLSKSTLENTILRRIGFQSFNGQSLTAIGCRVLRIPPDGQHGNIIELGFALAMGINGRFDIFQHVIKG